MTQYGRVSNPNTVQRKAHEIYGDDATIYRSKAKDKKYSIRNEQGKLINFGNIHYKDFTFTGDEQKRINYLKRSAGIKGNWKNDKYSPNNLSRLLLW